MKTYEETIKYMQQEMWDTSYDYKTIRLIAAIYSVEYKQVEFDLDDDGM